jgi:hypothetical protein
MPDRLSPAATGLKGALASRRVPVRGTCMPPRIGIDPAEPPLRRNMAARPSRGSRRGHDRRFAPPALPCPRRTGGNTSAAPAPAQAVADKSIRLGASPRWAQARRPATPETLRRIVRDTRPRQNPAFERHQGRLFNPNSGAPSRQCPPPRTLRSLNNPRFRGRPRTHPIDG